LFSARSTLVRLKNPLSRASYERHSRVAVIFVGRPDQNYPGGAYP
jgi:hypothetical protein